MLGRFMPRQSMPAKSKLVRLVCCFLFFVCGFFVPGALAQTLQHSPAPGTIL
jgi:hypothetical protein